MYARTTWLHFAVLAKFGEIYNLDIVCVHPETFNRLKNTRDSKRFLCAGIEFVEGAERAAEHSDPARVRGHLKTLT